jgi:hypothetical protein
MDQTKLDPPFKGGGKKRVDVLHAARAHKRSQSASVSHEEIGSCPGGAGPVRVVVKISHRLGIQTHAVVTKPMQ